MIAKNINKINHRAIKLRITGRLELGWMLDNLKRCTNQGLGVHCCLEQLIQAVRSLDELEGNRDDEELLQRGEDTLV